MAKHILRTDRSVYTSDPRFQEIEASIPSANEMAIRRHALRDPLFDARMLEALEGVDLSTQEGQDFYWAHSLAIGCQLDEEGY